MPSATAGVPATPVRPSLDHDLVRFATLAGVKPVPAGAAPVLARSWRYMGQPGVVPESAVEPRTAVVPVVSRDPVGASRPALQAPRTSVKAASTARWARFEGGAGDPRGMRPGNHTGAADASGLGASG